MVTRICCAHAGGQGKTTVSQVLKVLADSKGMKSALVSADFKDDTGRSKIGRMYPDEVKELGTGPDVTLAKVANDLNASLKYWDVLGSILMEGNTVVDMGANVVDQLLAWGKVRQAPKLLTAAKAPPVDVYLVCRAEQRAIDDLSDLVARFGSGESLPVNRIFVVLNEAGGGFEQLDIRKKLSKVKTPAEVNFVSFPRCSSELWMPMELQYCSLQTALNLDPEAAIEQLGIDMWSSYSAVDDLSSWLQTIKAEFKGVNAI